MRSFILIALLLALPAAAQTHDPRGRPMHDMQGDCANYRTDLAREQTLWRTPKAVLHAGAGGTEATAAMLPDRPTLVRLLPRDQVRFVVPPSENRGGPDRFAGILRIAALPPGQWRVSASGGLWLDLATATALLESPSFEMQTRCEPIFKTVAFQVPGGVPLFLQLNGSRSQTVEVLLTRVP